MAQQTKMLADQSDGLNSNPGPTGWKEGGDFSVVLHPISTFMLWHTHNTHTLSK